MFVVYVLVWPPQYVKTHCHVSGRILGHWIVLFQNCSESGSPPGDDKMVLMKLLTALVFDLAKRE